jgi:hypothetical protein
MLVAAWGDVFTDADGDAFTVAAAGGPSGLAENGALAISDASETLVFTPAFGAKTAKFSAHAQDVKGGDSGPAQISLTFGESPSSRRGAGACSSPSLWDDGLAGRTGSALTRNRPCPSSDGGARLAAPTIESVTAARGEAAGPPAAGGAEDAKSPAAAPAAACSGVQATGPARVLVTAGTSQVQANAKGKIKKFGLPLGFLLDILPAGAPATATADPACHIRVGGAIKAGATKARAVAAKKLTACYGALKLADCSGSLQARAIGYSGKKYKDGAPSKLVAFMPSCAPCSG